MDVVLIRILNPPRRKGKGKKGKNPDATLGKEGGVRGEVGGKQ